MCLSMCLARGDLERPSENSNWIYVEIMRRLVTRFVQAADVLIVGVEVALLPLAQAPVRHGTQGPCGGLGAAYGRFLARRSAKRLVFLIKFCQVFDSFIAGFLSAVVLCVRVERLALGQVGRFSGAAATRHATSFSCGGRGRRPEQCVCTGLGGDWVARASRFGPT